VVVVEVAQRAVVTDEEAGLAMAVSLGHLGQLTDNGAHSVQFVHGNCNVPSPGRAMINDRQAIVRGLPAPQPAWPYQLQAAIDSSPPALPAARSAPGCPARFDDEFGGSACASDVRRLDPGPR